MKFQPLDDRVLVKRMPNEVSALTIVLTDAEPNRCAQVVACGKGKLLASGKRRPMAVKPGDLVYLPGVASQFPDWADGEELLIREDDIAFVFEPSDN